MQAPVRFRLLALISLLFAVATLAALAIAPAIASRSRVGDTFYAADGATYAYAGRWELNNRVAKADWPCSGVQFSVTAAEDVETSFPISLKLNLHRVRVKVTVTNSITGTVESESILEGNSLIDYEKNYEIMIDNKSGAGTYTVSLTKLTQASPYGNGVGKMFKSILEFYGVDVDAKVATIGSAPLPSRRISVIGASDSAGYCVDGTPETNDSKINPWMYGNCDMTSHAVLGRRLNAETSVQAIAGIGLTQNAFAETPFLLGKGTMPDYYDRRLQTEQQPMKNLTEWRPDLVMVSLGGNDFNHQRTVPTDETFVTAYEDFLLRVAKPYMEDEVETPTILSICGQGDPTESARDPNNDRCRPCPHVEAAVKSFRAKHGETIRAEYLFIPCDGTVVTGVDDIGCDGHKNQLGQKRVADFLEPRLREIMDWPKEADELEPVGPGPELTFVAKADYEYPPIGGIAMAVLFAFLALRIRREAMRTAEYEEAATEIETIDLSSKEDDGLTLVTTC